MYTVYTWSPILYWKLNRRVCLNSKVIFSQQKKKKKWENQSNGHVVNQLPNVRYRDCFFKGLVGKKNPLYSIDRREDFYENVLCIYCAPARVFEVYLQSTKNLLYTSGQYTTHTHHVKIYLFSLALPIHTRSIIFLIYH